MAYGYIYKTTNLINGKMYIGQHKYSGEGIDPKYYGGGTNLTKALKKYGKENFKVEILELCNNMDEMNEREKYWIAFYDAVKSNIFYNLDLGGNNSSPTPETREKIRNTIKTTHHLWPHYGGRGKKKSPEECERIRKMNTGRPGYWKGKKLYPETVEKIRLNKIGRPSSKKGISVNEEIRQRLYKYYLENVENGSFSFKGHKHTEESKKIIGEKSILAVSGRIYIIKDNVEKRIKPEELENYLSNGWTKGRLKERTAFHIEGIKANTGIRKINKNGVNKNVPKGEVDKWLAEGWKLGSIENRQPWSEERKKENGKRIAELHTGRKIINNGIKNKSVKKEEVIEYLKNGWVLGKLPVGKVKEKLERFDKEKYWITDGKNNKYISKDKLDFFLQNGWKRGQTKKEKKENGI